MNFLVLLQVLLVRLLDVLEVVHDGGVLVELQLHLLAKVLLVLMGVSHKEREDLIQEVGGLLFLLVLDAVEQLHFRNEFGLFDVAGEVLLFLQLLVFGRHFCDQEIDENDRKENGVDDVNDPGNPVEAVVVELIFSLHSGELLIQHSGIIGVVILRLDKHNTHCNDIGGDNQQEGAGGDDNRNQHVDGISKPLKDSQIGQGPEVNNAQLNDLEVLEDLVFLVVLDIFNHVGRDQNNKSQDNQDEVREVVEVDQVLAKACDFDLNSLIDANEQDYEDVNYEQGDVV